jgi:phosphatidylglycerol:prolipoprotein diacylglycerol transferase
LTNILDAGIIASRGEPTLNLYSFLLGIGSSLSIWRVTADVPLHEKIRWASSALVVLLGALIGARIGFLLWQPAYLAAFGWQAMRIWEGGFIWPGAVLGAWLMILLLSWQMRQKVGFVADRMAVMVPPLAITIWLGCWMAGCGYGQVIPLNWQFSMTMDETGQWASRFPLQWVAAVTLFLVYFGWEQRFPSKRTGQRSAITWLIFMVHTLLFSIFRADLRPGWQGLSWDIWFAILYLVAALICFLIAFFPKKFDSEQPILKKEQ